MVHSREYGMATTIQQPIACACELACHYLYSVSFGAAIVLKDGVRFGVGITTMCESTPCLISDLFHEDSASQNVRDVYLTTDSELSSTRRRDHLT